MSFQVTPVDKIILDTSIASIETINRHIDTAVSKEISKYAAGDIKDVNILLSITGLDTFSTQCSYPQKKSMRKNFLHHRNQ